MMTAKRLKELADMAIVPDPMSQVALDELMNPELIRQQLKTEFEKHLRAKESLEGLVARIQRVSGKSSSRARAIARTEKTRAVNGERFARIVNDYLDRMDKARKGHRRRPDRPLITWIDPRTAKTPRHEHVAISGRTIPVGEEFMHNLHYPGDPQAPIEQVVNCHCYIRLKSR